MELIGFAVLFFVCFVIVSWAMRPDEKITKWEISKLEVKEGDVLLLRIKGEKVPMVELEKVKHETEKLFDNKIKCLFVLGDVEVSVITPANNACTGQVAGAGKADGLSQPSATCQ